MVLQPHAQAAPCTDCFVIAAAYSHNLHAMLNLRLALVMRSKTNNRAVQSNEGSQAVSCTSSQCQSRNLW